MIGRGMDWRARLFYVAVIVLLLWAGWWIPASVNVLAWAFYEWIGMRDVRGS